MSTLPYDLWTEPSSTSLQICSAGSVIDVDTSDASNAPLGYFKRRMLGAHARVLDGMYVINARQGHAKHGLLMEAGRVGLMALLDEPTVPERQLTTLRWSDRVTEVISRGGALPSVSAWPGHMNELGDIGLRAALVMARVGQGASWSPKSIRNQVWASLIHGLGRTLTAQEASTVSLETVIPLVTIFRPIPRSAYETLLYFRERLDGGGPMGIVGDALPLTAQYLGLVCWLEQECLFTQPADRWREFFLDHRSRLSTLFREDVVRNVAQGLEFSLD